MLRKRTVVHTLNLFWHLGDAAEVCHPGKFLCQPKNLRIVAVSTANYYGNVPSS
jgi:hypothetical protein